jgi:hypothetical protein
MAANKKAPIAVAVQNGGTAYSLHHGLAGHFRMDRAVVGICTCLGKLPTGTVIVCGPKTKLSILTAAFAAEGRSAFAATLDDPANSSSIASSPALPHLQSAYFFFVICRFLTFDFLTFPPRTKSSYELELGKAWNGAGNSSVPNCTSLVEEEDCGSESAT